LSSTIRIVFALLAFAGKTSSRIYNEPMAIQSSPRIS
jgi:hypothetical protein